MKVWSKVHITDKNSDIETISKSFTNYLYGFGPVNDLCRKYSVSDADRKMLDQFTANRIAGLFMGELKTALALMKVNEMKNRGLI